MTHPDISHLVISIGIWKREYCFDDHITKPCSRAPLSGFAVVMAEDPAGVRNHIGIAPGKRLRQRLGSILFVGIESWENLCPIYNSLSPSQLGAANAKEQAANITSILLPN